MKPFYQWRGGRAGVVTLRPAELALIFQGGIQPFYLHQTLE